MLDLILFAAFALYMGIKLYKALGDKKYDNDFDSAQNVKRKYNDNVVEGAFEEVEDNYDEVAKNHGQDIADQVKQLHKIDRYFTEKSFIEGAKYAFEIIFGAISQNDKKALSGLLSKDLYNSFANAIESRKKSTNIEQITLIAILDPVIREISTNGFHTKITAEMSSEQVSVIKDADGNIIAGDSSHVENITELWTFARNFKSSDPNWELIKTATV